MVSIQRLQNEGLIPMNAGNTGGPVAFGNYYCVHWGYTPPSDIRKMNFSEEDFVCIYLQIETGTQDGFPFQRISVKMSIDEDEAGRSFDKERVRWARKRIQDYFACNVEGCERTKFQFASPKPEKEHASWMTVCRIPYDDYNYEKRIKSTQDAFDKLK